MRGADRREGSEPVGATPLDLLHSADPPPFALLHRPESTGSDRLDMLVGDVRPVRRLGDLPLPGAVATGEARHDTLAVVPFRQVREQDFECRDDQAPILAMTVRHQFTVPLSEALDRLPVAAVSLTGAGFDIDDQRYAEVVRTIIAEEIGTGAGSNFVIKRNFRAQIGGDRLPAALALFRSLLIGELGAYWTFLVHTGDRTFVGATPERHVSAQAGEVVMNPISGTYRYPSTGPSLPGTLAFLSDRKEADELYMVVDEELKMMADVCAAGGRVAGPHLKAMARVAHTEYLLHGHSSLDVREVLRRTLVAPTVTGSPVANACRVIARHEPGGRRYYSGVVALIGRDPAGQRELDSAILIRTADIASSGRMEIGVGATLVRESDPVAEVAETRAKAAGLLAAAGADPDAAARSGQPGTGDPAPGRSLASDHQVLAALQRRNTMLAQYWFTREEDRRQPHPGLAGKQVLVLDAEDTFTAMLATQLSSLELRVTIRPCTETTALDDFDLVVAGPGPGDPRDREAARIVALREVVGRSLRSRAPLLCVCLSHQILASALGMQLVRKSSPAQGVQREIDLFGRRERVGFYNTFAARVPQDLWFRAGHPGPVQVSRDRTTNEVHALRGPGFASTQFHPESLLTQNGVDILAELVGYALSDRPQGMLRRSG